MSQIAQMVIHDHDTASSFAEQLHGLMLSLTAHLRRETKALRNGAYTEGLADHETKSELVFAYRDALANLQKYKDALSRFVPVKLEELRKLNTAFQAELQVNLAAVSTAKAVSEQLLTRLADQVQARQRPKTYGASGTMTRAKGMSAISVDRAL